MHHWSQFFLKIDIISKVLIRLDSICYLCTKCPKSRKTSSTPLVAWPVIISENERLTLLWYSWKTHVKKSTPEKEISAWLNPGPGCHDNYHKKRQKFLCGKVIKLKICEGKEHQLFKEWGTLNLVLIMYASFSSIFDEVALSKSYCQKKFDDKNLCVNPCKDWCFCQNLQSAFDSWKSWKSCWSWDIEFTSTFIDILFDLFSSDKKEAFIKRKGDICISWIFMHPSKVRWFNPFTPIQTLF